MLPSAASLLEVRVPSVSRFPTTVRDATFMNTLANPRPVIQPNKQPAPIRHTENFHGLKPEYAENSILKAVANGSMLPDDADLVREFIAEMKATKGIRLGRSNKLIYTLVRWRSFVGPYRTNTLTNLYEGIERLKAARLPDGMPFKQNTLRDFLAALKRFYLWMLENHYVDLPEKKLKGLQCMPADTMTKTAEQLLTEDDVRAMIDSCRTSRDRVPRRLLWCSPNPILFHRAVEGGTVSAGPRPPQVARKR